MDAISILPSYRLTPLTFKSLKAYKEVRARFSPTSARDVGNFGGRAFGASQVV